MRPLDFLGRIKIKLGLAVCLAVVVAFVVNEVGINAGLGRELRIAVAVALALLMVQLLGRGMIRPLREMAAAAQTIAKGRYGQRVRATSRDEVGELARAFNAMAADLGEVDRQRRELVANVSHELRTPITALRAVLENVVDGVSEPDVHTLGIALAQTERLGRLVAQLLDLSRLDSGAMHIDPETVGLEPLLDQAAREAALTRDDVTVRVAVRPAGLSVHADPGLLAQVLANLLDNAVRHSPPGGTVTLSAVPAPPSPASPGVQIAVADQGPGIPQAERTRVFERFSRLDAARAADAGGTGLGLAIVKEIVELHGGSIHIDDSPGCRMVVGLPGRITMGDSPTPEPPPSPTARPLAAPVPRKTTATTENAAGTEGAAREPAPTEPVPATTAPPSPAIAMAEAALPPAPDADATAPEMPATPAVAQGVAGSGVTEIVVAHGAPGSGVPEAVGSGVTQAPGPMTPVPGAGTEVQEPAVVPATGSGAKEVVVARLGSNVPEATAPPVGVTEAVGGLAVPEGAGVPVAAMGAVGSGVSEAVAPPTGATRAQEGAGIAAAEAGVPVTAAVAEGAAGSGVTEVVTAPGASGSGVTEAVVPPVGVAGARGATGLGAAETAGVPLAATGAEEGTGVAVPEAAGVPGNVGVGHEAVPAVLASGESGAAVPPVGVTGAQGAAGVAAAEPAGGPVTAAAQAAVGSGAPGAAASTTSAAETKGAADPAASRAVGAPVAAAGAPGAGAAVSGAVGVPGTGAAASGAVGVPGAGAAVSGVVGAPGAGSAVKVGVPGAGGDVKERAGGVRPGGAGMPADVGRGRVGPPPPPPGQWAPGGPGGPGGAGGESYPANWWAAIGFAVVGACCGLIAAVVVGAVLSVVGFALAMLAAFGCVLAGAFIGTVLGATRKAPAPVRPANAPEKAPGGPSYVPPSVLPRPEVPAMPSWVLPAMAGAGLVAAVTLPYAAPGLGLVLTAVALGVVGLPALWRRITPWSLGLGLLGYALVGVALVRDADWLVTPLALAGFCIAALALSGLGASWLGTLKGGASVLLALIPLPWFVGGPLKAAARRRPRKMAPIAVGVGLTAALLLVFGALFASADPVFSAFLTDAFTAADWAETLPLRIVAFIGIAILAGAVALAGLRPGPEPERRDFGLNVGRAGWLIPLTALNLLFAAFVAVQITVLFGGNERVLTTAGLTYAEYARQGFFQLVVVSVFVLAVVAVAAVAVAVDGRDRWTMAGLLGLLCALTMVIMWSAIQRLHLYVDMYGYSRLRAVVEVTLWWLGAVFVLVLIAGAMRLMLRRGGWLPRALVAVTGVAMLAFAVWNPDLRIAETQIKERGLKFLDAAYLSDLGADAVPAISRLPEPLRSCVLADVVVANDLNLPDPWNGWNLARQQAHELLAERPVTSSLDCRIGSVTTTGSVEDDRTIPDQD